MHSVRWGRTRAGDPPPTSQGTRKYALEEIRFSEGRITDTGASLPHEWEYPRNENEKPLLHHSPSLPFLHSHITFSFIPSVPGMVN